MLEDWLANLEVAVGESCHEQSRDDVSGVDFSEEEELVEEGFVDLVEIPDG